MKRAEISIRFRPGTSRAETYDRLAEVLLSIVAVAPSGSAGNPTAGGRVSRRGVRGGQHSGRATPAADASLAPMVSPGRLGHVGEVAGSSPAPLTDLEVPQ